MSDFAPGALNLLEMSESLADVLGGIEEQLGEAIDAREHGVKLQDQILGDPDRVGMVQLILERPNANGFVKRISMRLFPKS